MPSTLVHVAVAGLVGTALLGAAFDRRAILAVLLVAAIPDLDAFAGLVLAGAHRSLLHSFLPPTLAAALLWYDTRRGGRLRARWGPGGVRVAWVALAGFVCGGILPDLFTNGVNVLYPLHDAFYAVDGKALLSNQRGFVQTFVDLSPEEPAKTTENLRYVTGVNPTGSTEPAPEDVERVFPLAASGVELMLVVLGAFSVGTRLWEARAAE